MGPGLKAGLGQLFTLKGEEFRWLMVTAVVACAVPARWASGLDLQLVLREE